MNSWLGLPSRSFVPSALFFKFAMAIPSFSNLLTCSAVMAFACLYTEQIESSKLQHFDRSSLCHWQWLSHQNVGLASLSVSDDPTIDPKPWKANLCSIPTELKFSFCWVISQFGSYYSFSSNAHFGGNFAGKFNHFGIGYGQRARQAGCAIPTAVGSPERGFASWPKGYLCPRTNRG